MLDRRVELEEVGEGGEALVGVEVLGRQLELVHQRGQHPRRKVGLVLETHGRPHAPLAQPLLDAGEQVFHAPPRELDVGVARDPDRVTGEDVVAVVKARQVQPDDVLQQHERVLAGGRRQRDEARDEMTREVDHGEDGVGQGRLARGPDRGDQAERAVGEIRERVAGVDRQRREDGKQRAAEIVLEEPLLGRVHVLGPQDADALGGEPGLDVLQEAAVLLGHQLVRPLGDGLQDLGGGEPVRTPLTVARVEPPLEAGHPDHEELVEVGAEDGEELDALEEGDGLLLGLARGRAG